MNSSKQWIDHFNMSATQQRINCNLKPAITEEQIALVLRSMQAWQLGETSEGKDLMRATKKYAQKIGDPDYVMAVSLFIKEEQKHGNNLGKYLDAIGRPRIRHDWGDTLFRKVRHLNTSMEMWTLTVIIVESTAQIFYQSLKDATSCDLLQQICTDILIDEAYHIHFQTERLAILFEHKTASVRILSTIVYPLFFFATATVVWLVNRRLFEAGGNPFSTYIRKMKCKYRKTLRKVTNAGAYPAVHTLAVK